MATVTVRGAPGQRRGATVTRRHHTGGHTSRAVLRWLGRHTWYGTSLATRAVSRRAGKATVRAAKHTHGRASQWAADIGAFGFGRGLSFCHCGWRGPADRHGQHYLDAHAHEEPEHPANGFSGEHVRANEPTRAYAQRMDRAAPTPISPEEASVNDPTNWAHSAEVLAEPSLGSTEATIEWLEAAAKGAHQLDQHFDALVEYMRTISMDKRIVDHIGTAHELVGAIHEQLDQAHKRAADLWGDISVPEFHKAS